MPGSVIVLWHPSSHAPDKNTIGMMKDMLMKWAGILGEL
jgi:hypothetical protein